MRDFKNAKKCIFILIKWLFLSLFIGIVCGMTGALFSKAIEFVTEFRAQRGWILYLLPLGGVVSVFLYRLLKISDMGTNQVLASAHSDFKVSPKLAPAVFIGTVITHAFGGSAGREGAALQLGGSLATLSLKVLKLEEKYKRALILSGMGALFSAVFGTPLGAAVFVLEVVHTKKVQLFSIFPVLVSSFTAFLTAVALGVKPERFTLHNIYSVNFDNLWKTAVISAAGAIVSMLFCKALHSAEKLFKKIIANEFLRIAIGGAIIVVLTKIVGTNDYNGSGINIIDNIFSNGQLNYEAFALKFVFTVITVAAGFKGGEIIPSFFIGSTLGGAIALLLGLDISLGACVGMVSLFCGVTNCPIASLVLSIEIFGIKGVLFYLISVIISFLASGKANLYEEQNKSVEEI